MISLDRLLVSICYALSTFGLVTAADFNGKEDPFLTRRPPSYIIELNPGDSNSKTHFDFHDGASRMIDYTLRHSFDDPEYFFGVSINVQNHDDVNDLLRLPEVKNIYVNRNVERPAPFDTDPFNTGSDKVARVQSKENETVSHITGTSDVNSALKMTGVDKLHKLGIKGKGIRIGIIDSGVDYRHPALGGGFGEGFKIAGGYDFIGDDWSGHGETHPDADPLTTCLSGGHGTHVAGTLGAQDPEGIGFGIVGVAPEATYYAYKVIGCRGGTTEDILLQALIKAGQDNVNLISMSIGGLSPWETGGSPLTSTLAALNKREIGLVFSGGNDGSRGPYTASSPSFDPNVIAVGSITNAKFSTIYHAEDISGTAILYASLLPVNQTVPFNVFEIAPRLAESQDCDKVRESVTRATITFSKNLDHVVAIFKDDSLCQRNLSVALFQAGIKLLIVWDDKLNNKIDPPGATLPFKLVRAISAEAGKILAGISTYGTDYTLNFKDNAVYDVNQPTGGTIDSYSEIGPTVEMTQKPDISGPGGYILSTWPITGGVGYAIISGTSMSTPHVAGAYALIKCVYPNLTSSEIGQLLKNTASPVSSYGNPNILTTVLQQGAGLINVYNAIKSESDIWPTVLNLRDTAKPATQTITIRNKSHLSKIYVLGHRGSAQLDALPNIYKKVGFEEQWSWLLIENRFYSCVSFSTKRFVLRPYSSSTFTVRITPPSGLDPNKLPLYSGYITITESNNTYVVPYSGVPYSRSSRQFLDTTDQLNISSTPLPVPPVPSLPFIQGEHSETRDNFFKIFSLADPPLIVAAIRQPSPYVRIDAVPVTTPFNPTTYGYNPYLSISLNTTMPPNSTILEDVFGVQSYGLISSRYGPDIPIFADGPFAEPSGGYGLYFSYWDWATVQLRNGTLRQLPNADYRVLIRALKWGGDVGKAQDWESWLSPVVGLRIEKGEDENPCLLEGVDGGCESLKAR